jgi:hypothetical protein
MRIINNHGQEITVPKDKELIVRQYISSGNHDMVTNLFSGTDQKMDGGPMDMQDGGKLDRLIYNKEEIKKADPITTGIKKTMDADWNRYAKLDSTYNSIVSGSPYDVKDTSAFTVKDIENGKPGIRNGAKVNKQILADMSKAAAKEGLPLMTALETGMRETGLGSDTGYSKKNPFYSQGLSPENIMQGWNARTVKGMPDSYDQYLLKNNLVPKDMVLKDKEGYKVNNMGNNKEYLKNLDKYEKYLSSFKADPALKEPFRKEMRFLKDNTGQKYNSGEKDRMTKLERERKVIMNNPQLYNYADSVYNSVKALGGGLDKLPNTGRILDRTSTGGNMKDKDDNSENIVTQYNGGGTHEQNSNGGIQIGGKAKVEDGEVRFDDPDDKSSYVFSNRIPYNRK